MFRACSLLVVLPATMGCVQGGGRLDRLGRLLLSPLHRYAGDMTEPVCFSKVVKTVRRTLVAGYPMKPWAAIELTNTRMVITVMVVALPPSITTFSMDMEGSMMKLSGAGITTMVVINRTHPTPLSP